MCTASATAPSGNQELPTSPPVPLCLFRGSMEASSITPNRGLQGITSASLVLDRFGDEQIILVPLLLPPATRHGLSHGCHRVRASLGRQIAHDSRFEIYGKLHLVLVGFHANAGGLLPPEPRLTPRHLRHLRRILTRRLPDLRRITQQHESQIVRLVIPPRGGVGLPPPHRVDAGA